MAAAKKLNFVKDEKSFVCVVWSMPSESGLKIEKIVKITMEKSANEFALKAGIK